jgi:hypothetical protein
MAPVSALRLVKLAHTAVWVFFVSCIFSIPLLALQGRFRGAAMLVGLVFLEVLVLFANHWRCPLTDVAARYTGDRRPNFDIYLPTWIARYNKEIFGPIFVAVLIFSLLLWVT